MCAKLKGSLRIVFLRGRERLARPERFELPTYCSGGNRSIQLSYGRALRKDIIRLSFLCCGNHDCFISLATQSGRVLRTSLIGNNGTPRRPAAGGELPT